MDSRMTVNSLDEREFELINIVGAQLGSNQRDLSRHMDLSLGSINMLLRRLIAKGYIRTKQLDKRRVKYILTPKGFSEKMHQSMKYTVKTICSIGLIKDRIKEIIKKLYFEDGERNFIILGESDLALLIEIGFRELNIHDFQITYADIKLDSDLSGVLMICREDVCINDCEGRKIVDVIHELAKDSFLINQVEGVV